MFAAALAETDEVDVDARAEPVLALTILAGMAAMLIGPGWNVIDDWTSRLAGRRGCHVHRWPVLRCRGLLPPRARALARGEGRRGRPALQVARQVVAFAALPFALSLAVVVPAIVFGYGEDWFRSGGDDDAGNGRTVITGIGLAFVLWSLGLVTVGLRTTFRRPWRGVVAALMLAGVLVAAFAVLPSAL